MRNLLVAGVAMGALALGACATTGEPAATASIAAPTRAAAIDVPLIPREALFGNPVRTAGQLSPDGRWVAWMAPVNGVRNVFVAPASNPGAARQVTSSTSRPIPQFFFSPDSSQIIFLQDRGGDENFLLYAAPVAGGAERTLTPFQNTRVRVVGTSNTNRNEVLVGLNNRDPRWHDVYRLNLQTGQLTQVMNGDGWGGFLADDSLTVRMGAKPNAQGGLDWFRITNGRAEERPFLSTDLEDAGTGPAGYTFDGRTLYWTDTRGRDTAALYAEDTATGQRRLIGESPRADIAGTLTNPRTGEVQGYAEYYLRNQWNISDPQVKRDYDFLKQRFGDADVSITSRTDDDSRWLVSVDPVYETSKVYLFDRASRRVTEFYTPRPVLAGAPLVPMHPVEIRSRDGLTLPSYLTLPAHADRNRDGRAESPVPMVLLVHGGPWARDGYGYNTQHQWLANRGYAVLSVNYRSSTGFGKRFGNAGNMQWGLAMHDDLIDAVNWAVRSGVTSPDKVAIMGGSYGGYATLAGLAFTPTTFACGVDIVGPSNLQTLLSTIPPYWEAGRRRMYRQMGDPTTAEGRAILDRASPLNRANEIVRPLLIGQGANDPRVKQAESDQIVQSLQGRSVPVTYVLFPDEGHGFARPQNNIAFQAVAENFLAGCLGGRAEPIGNALAPSTAQVVTGAQHVPGLAEAVARRGS